MNRRLTRLVASLTLVVGASGSAAAPREMVIVPYGDQRLEYESGVRMVVSEGRFVVVADVEGINGKTGWIGLSIYNPTGESVNFTEESVLAREPLGPMKLLRSADIMKKERRKQVWENIGAGLVAGANAYNASQAGNYTARGNFSGQVNTYGNRGTSQSTVRGNYIVSGNDPAATQLALMRASYENRQLISSVQGNQAEREAQLSQMLLRSETIRPGGAHSGRLQVQLPPKIRRKATQAFNIAVKVGGEDHHFLVYLDGAPTATQLAEIQSVRVLPKRAQVAQASKVAEAPAPATDAGGAREPPLPPRYTPEQLAPVTLPTNTTSTVASEARASAAEADPIAEWRRLQSEAETLYGKGNEAEALEKAMLGLKILDARQTDEEELVEALLFIGPLQTHAGDHQGAISTLRRALVLSRRLYAHDAEEGIEPLTKLALALAVSGDADEALTFARRGLHIARIKLDPSDPLFAGLLGGVGYLNYLAGNLIEAEKALNESIAAFHRANESDTEATTPYLLVLGITQALQKKYGEAERSAKHALSNLAMHADSDPFDLVLLHALLLESYTGQGKRAEVDSTVQQIKALVDSLPKQDRDALPASLTAIARTWTSNGWHDGVAAINRLVDVINGTKPQLVASAQPGNTPPPTTPTVASHGASKITAVLKKVETTRTRVYFDVGWHVDRPVSEKGQPIYGTLVLSDTTSQRTVSMPWTIPAADADLGIFIKEGIGFDLSTFGETSGWIAELANDWSTVSASYIVDRNKK
jgi:tetratricopeptide (TPR) repeat protein